MVNSKRRIKTIPVGSVVVSRNEYEGLKEAIKIEDIQKDMIKFLLNIFYTKKLTDEEINGAATKAGFKLTFKNEYGQASVLGDGKERHYILDRSKNI